MSELFFWILAFGLFLLPLIATRNIYLPAISLLSFLTIILPLRYETTVLICITSAVTLVILAILVKLTYRKGIFRFNKTLEIKWWRIIARPFAILFIPIGMFLGESFLLYLLGILSTIFVLTDLFRLFSGKLISAIYKKSESRRFSSMSSFLVAIFLIFLLFQQEVAYLCLVFILFGDMAGKIIGIQFGRVLLIHKRTLEGSLGFLTGSLYSGLIICTIFSIDFQFLLIGAICATLAELFSCDLDDNFTVGILTGGCLEALKYFNVI